MKVVSLLDLVNYILKEHDLAANIRTDWLVSFANQFSAKKETFADEVIFELSHIDNPGKGPAQLLADMGEVLLRQSYSYGQMDTRLTTLAHCCYLGAQERINPGIPPDERANLEKNIVMAEKMPCLIEILGWIQQGGPISAEHRLKIKSFQDSFAYQSNAQQLFLEETLKFFRAQLLKSTHGTREKFQTIFDTFTELGKLLQERNARLVTDVIRPQIDYYDAKLETYKAVKALKKAVSLLPYGSEVMTTVFYDMAKYAGWKEGWQLSQEEDQELKNSDNINHKRIRPHDGKKDGSEENAHKRPKIG